VTERSRDVTVQFVRLDVAGEGKISPKATGITSVQRKRADRRGSKRPSTRQQPQVSFEKQWARKTESTACKANTSTRGKRSDP